MRCYFCEKSVRSTDEAMNRGWEPDFWINERTYVGHPLCTECAVKYVDWPKSEGDRILRTDVFIPFLGAEGALPCN